MAEETQLTVYSPDHDWIVIGTARYAMGQPFTAPTQVIDGLLANGINLKLYEGDPDDMPDVNEARNRQFATSAIRVGPISSDLERQLKAAAADSPKAHKELLEDGPPLSGTTIEGEAASLVLTGTKDGEIPPPPALPGTPEAEAEQAEAQGERARARRVRGA